MPISIKVNKQWDLGIQAPNTNANWHTLLMTEHNPSDFAVPTSGGNGLADLSFLNESTMATGSTTDTTTVVTATGTIPLLVPQAVLHQAMHQAPG